MTENALNIDDLALCQSDLLRFDPSIQSPNFPILLPSRSLHSCVESLVTSVPSKPTAI